MISNKNTQEDINNIISQLMVSLTDVEEEKNKLKNNNERLTNENKNLNNKINEINIIINKKEKENNDLKEKLSVKNKEIIELNNI